MATSPQAPHVSFRIRSQIKPNPLTSHNSPIRNSPIRKVLLDSSTRRSRKSMKRKLVLFWKRLTAPKQARRSLRFSYMPADFVLASKTSISQTE
ncbi:unnamed protein product [Mycena citricolor]|uniref:Uncharacterized protein n=1 Tax=Mycena citricolor TaxID=2018698 RepID=A0AAD2JXN9_9AGAR|nr:unnamed protein product [Mycena citricolor]